MYRFTIPYLGDCEGMLCISAASAIMYRFTIHYLGDCEGMLCISAAPATFYNTISFCIIDSCIIGMINMIIDI